MTPGLDDDTAAALASIKARTIRIGSLLPAGRRGWEVRVIPDIWEHVSGGGKNPTDTTFTDNTVTELLG